MLDATDQPQSIPTPPQSTHRQRLARPFWVMARYLCLLAYRIEFGRPFLTYREDGTRRVVTGVTLSQD